MVVHRISTIRQVLRDAAHNRLEEAWIYLKDEAELGLESPCLVLPESAGEGAPMVYAGAWSFPLEGLSTELIGKCIAWARRYETMPSDRLLLYAFRYYWRFEKFPEQAWAPYPPADEEVPISRAPGYDHASGAGSSSENDVSDLDLGHEDFLQYCYENLEAQTEINDRLFQISSASGHVDLKAGRIVFTSPQGIRATAAINVIGTFSKVEGRWLWAWANPAIPASLCGNATTAKAYGAKYSIEDYIVPMLDCGEDKGWEFTAVANQLGDGQGAYRAPDGDRLMYLCFGAVMLEAI